MKFDIVFLHPPSIYDFRERPMFPGPVAGTVHFTPVFTGIPIGLLSMAEYADRLGYRTRVFNIGEYMITDRNFDFKKFIGEIESDFIGIDLHFCVHSQGALRIAKICKEQKENARVVLGGLTASKFSEELMRKYPFVDYVIKGEAEVPLIKLLEGREHGSIENLVYRENDRIKASERRWIAEDLDEFDFTRLDLVTPKEHITTLRSEVGVIKHWMTPVCRGCIFNCVSCGGSKYAYADLFHRERPVFRSKEKIVEDLEKLSRQGIESVFLFMDMRMGGKKYWKPLINEISTNASGIKYLTLELFTPADREFMSEIAKLNESIRVGLSISPESGNDEVRANHGRHYTTENLMNTARLCRANGIGLGVFFMFGLGTQTEQSLEDTFNAIKRLVEVNEEPGSGPGVRAQYGSMLLLDPGSLAFNDPEKYGYKLIFENLEDYVRGMSSTSWTDWQSFYTEKLSRRQFLQLPIDFRKKMIDYYHSKGMISDEQKEVEDKKHNINMIIMEELESISKLKNEKEKDNRYWSLYNALKNYNKGEISLLWRMKRKIGI